MITYDSVRKEQNETESEIEKITRGKPSQKKRKTEETKEKRIQNIIHNGNDMSTLDFLRDIAHNLSL